MPKKVVQRIIKEELAVDDLSEMFEEIDLDSPLGSTSIAQVCQSGWYLFEAQSKSKNRFIEEN